MKKLLIQWPMASGGQLNTALIPNGSMIMTDISRKS